MGTEQGETVISTQPAAGVGLIEIDRPEARNALNLDVRKALANSVEAFAGDPHVRAIVIAGRGGNFVAGADIKAFAAMGSTDVVVERLHQYWDAISRCGKPIIAAVEGYALGGGCELAMHADIIVAARTATFGQPEVKIGLMPGAGGTQRLLRIAGKHKAMRYLLTGEMFSAEEAERLGLVSYLCDEGSALENALAVAGTIAQMPPMAVEHIKEAVQYGESGPLDAALRIERKSFQLLFDTADKQEGISAFLEKRKPAFRGR